MFWRLVSAPHCFADGSGAAAVSSESASGLSLHAGGNVIVLQCLVFLCQAERSEPTDSCCDRSHAVYI